MIYSVGMQQRWFANQIDYLFLDAQDHWGLVYWFENIKRYSKELKNAASGTK